MTQEGRRACDWKSTSKQVGGKTGKSVFPKAEMRWGASGNRREGAGTKLSRKASSEESGTRTETDTGRQDENSKVRGKTSLRNSAKCIRNFGKRITRRT